MDTQDPHSIPSLAFTVFTAAWNRPETLARAFDSLCAQTLRDFEWLIIDDGSGPAVSEAVRALQARSPFPIRYHWQENRGKWAAQNRAVQMARGRFFLPLDDDDEAHPQALETFLAAWNAIPPEQQPDVAGVVGLCVDEHGCTVGDRFPQECMDATFFEMTYRHRVSGEKSAVTRTDLMRTYPFPQLAGYSGYMPEGLVWSQIARRYRYRFINRVVRTFYTGHASVTNSNRRAAGTLRGAPAFALQHLDTLNHEIGWLAWAPAAFVRSAVHYVRFSALQQISLPNQARALRPWPARLLWLAALPAGLAVARRDRLRAAAEPSTPPAPAPASLPRGVYGR